MRKVIVTSVLTFIFLVAFWPFADAEMAKEGTVSGTSVYGGTYNVMPLEKDTYVVTFEHTGVLTDDCNVHQKKCQFLRDHFYCFPMTPIKTLKIFFLISNLLIILLPLGIFQMRNTWFLFYDQ